jgi:peroxiredoxin
MASKFIGLLLIALFIVGCNNKPTPLAPTNTPENIPAATNPPVATNVAIVPTAPPAGFVPAWISYKLTDVRSNKPFTLGDFKGKTTYVGLFTIGCANCRTQLNNLKAAIGKLGADKYGYVGLSVESSLKNEDLAKFANDAGFNWQFAVVPSELLAMWSLSFGRAAVEPTNAVYFVIYPDETISKLYAGDVQSVDDLARILSTPK